MAKPPEPIEDVIPQATWVVDAEVLEVLATGPQPPKVEAKPGATSTGQKTASQSVKLKVTRVLHGTRLPWPEGHRADAPLGLVGPDGTPLALAEMHDGLAAYLVVFS